MTVVFIVFNELTTNGVHYVFQNGLDRGEQEVLFHHRQCDIQHQVVFQVLCRQAELSVKNDGRQTVNAECRDNLLCYRFVCNFREGPSDNVLQHAALLQHLIDGWLYTLGRVAFDAAPISIIGHDARLTVRYFLIDYSADGFGYGLQHFTLFDYNHTLEGTDVGWVYREQVHIFIKLLRHALIERAKRH